MNDLNTINRLNAEAAAAEIPQLRAAGKFVVAKYSGLHYVGHDAFDTADQAKYAIAQIERANVPGDRTQLLEPTETAVYVPTGDESPSLATLAQTSFEKQADNEKAFELRSSLHNPVVNDQAEAEPSTDTAVATDTATEASAS